jgi:hypothetical protein
MDQERHMTSDVNQSLDSRRLARDQDSRIAATASIGLNAIKPFVQFQTSILRVFADNCELMAHNYETNLNALLGASAGQQQQQ